MKALESVDSDFRECFADMCALQLSDEAWKQAQLSLSCGGIGLLRDSILTSEEPITQRQLSKRLDKHDLSSLHLHCSAVDSFDYRQPAQFVPLPGFKPFPLVPQLIWY